MKYQVISLYDAKAEQFNAPSFYPTVAVGLRTIVEVATHEDSALKRFSRDFTVFKVGEYESDTGVLTPCPAFDLGTIADLLKPHAVADKASKLVGEAR